MELIRLDSTILVVEDNPYILDNLRKMFNLVFTRVLAAKDGNEAMNILEKLNIDVICTDILMPYDGVDLIQNIRNRLKLDIPIIVNTAHDEYKTIYADIPNTFVVTKPASVDDFLEVFKFIRKDIERNASYAKLDEVYQEAKDIVNLLKDMKC